MSDKDVETVRDGVDAMWAHVRRDDAGCGCSDFFDLGGGPPGMELLPGPSRRALDSLQHRLSLYEELEKAARDALASGDETGDCLPEDALRQALQNLEETGGGK